MRGHGLDAQLDALRRALALQRGLRHAAHQQGHAAALAVHPRRAHVGGHAGQGGLEQPGGALRAAVGSVHDHALALAGARQPARHGPRARDHHHAAAHLRRGRQQPARLHRRQGDGAQALAALGQLQQRERRARIAAHGRSRHVLAGPDAHAHLVGWAQRGPCHHQPAGVVHHHGVARLARPARRAHLDHQHAGQHVPRQAGQRQAAIDGRPGRGRLGRRRGPAQGSRGGAGRLVGPRRVGRQQRTQA